MLKDIKKFFEPIFIEPKYFYKTISMRGIQGFAAVFNIFMIQKIIESFELGKIELLQSYIRWYAIINIILYILIFLTKNWAWGETTQHIFKMLHRIYMKDLNTVDNTYIENIGTGKIISIYSKGVYSWTMFLMDFFEVGVKLLFSLGASIVLLYQLGSIFVIVFFVVFLGVHGLVYIFNEKAKYWREGRIDMMHEYDKQIVKIIMSKFEILQNNKMQREIQVLDTYIDQAKYYNMKLNSYLVAMINLPNLIFFIFSLAILLMLMNIHITFASIVSLFMILGLLKENMYSSINFFKNITKDSYQIQKVWQLFDEAPRIPGLFSGKIFQYKYGEVQIEKLNFSYGNNKVFQDFSIQIHGGQKVALVGASGGGKTTLVKLISGFLSPNSGEIIIDGQKLSELNLISYYKHIGYLTQDPSVFDGNIRENLMYGIGAETSDIEAKIKQAILDAKCEFIYDFKDGLETQIGERGVRLSGGQKQRLAIAKLFLKNPEIIILDEPTSALDSFSEESMRQSFEKLFTGKTVFIIAHRLQTVKTADDIIVFNEGKIIERGTHEDLIKKNGYYKKMLDLQSGF